MLAIHAAALGSGNTVLHDFLLRYAKETKIVYGIVEGKEDPMFYRSIIEKTLPGDWNVELIIAGNKKKVFESYNKFDWFRFSKNRVAFFVDKDLNEFHNDIPFVEKNLFVTDYYSIENYVVNFDVFRRFLEEVLNITRLLPSEVASLRDLYERNFGIFSEFMTHIMAQIILWRRNSIRPNLSNLKLNDFFSFTNGRLQVCDAYSSIENKIKHLSKSVKAIGSPIEDVNTANDEFKEKGGHENFIRGKYLLWLFVETALEIHKNINVIITRFPAPPKLHITIGTNNAMLIIAPRVRCPTSLASFLEETFGSYIREKAVSA